MSIPTANIGAAVPQFYFPKRLSSDHNDKCSLYKDPLMMRNISDLFENKDFLIEQDFLAVTNACSLPRYMNLAFFRAIDSIDSNSTALQPTNNTEQITFQKFKKGWSTLTKGYNHDDSDSIMYSILKKPGFDCITPDDFLPILEDIVLNHPALKFLENNINFQERYIETVICRIFYEAHCPSGKLSLRHFTKSGFATILRNLTPSIDLYTIHNVFSYKQFYVLYCKLWSLDLDHDLSLSENDLENYNMGTLTRLAVERIMRIGHIPAFTEPAVIKSEDNKPAAIRNQPPPNITYFDFIWFLLSEVDKSTPIAIDYWFRCLDIDGDGVLSAYELYLFWQDQYIKQKLYSEIACVSIIQFTDIMRQINDLIQPEIFGQFKLKDLKKNGFLAERFFDTFINFDKFQVHDSHQEGSIREQQYFEHMHSEKNDMFDKYQPPVLLDDLGFPVLSNWNDYADFEYDRITMDENFTNNDSSKKNEQADDNILELNEGCLQSVDDDEGVVTIFTHYKASNENEFSFTTTIFNDDILIEEVNDPSTINVEDFAFDDYEDNTHNSISTDIEDDLNDEVDDFSTLSSVCSISSSDFETHTPELHDEAGYLSSKSVCSPESTINTATTSSFTFNL